MDIKLRENQKLTQTLNPKLITTENILQYSLQELIGYLNETLSQNPLIEDYYFEDPPSLNISEENDINEESESNLSVYDIYAYNTYKNVTLKEYLFNQIPIKEDKLLKKYIKYIIENIDEDGLLKCNINELCIKPFTNKQLIEKAVNIVKDMDPCGVGSKDMKECLKKQLKKLNITDGNIIKIIDCFLHELAFKDYTKISKELNISFNEIMKINELIKSLNPLPGIGFTTSNNSNYVIPDVIIKNDYGNLKIAIPDYTIPKLKLSSKWLDYLNNQNDILNKYLLEIHELEKNIDIRFKNLSKIAEYIVITQELFLKGISKSKSPVKISDAAKKTNLSISTVSRTIKNKYIKTPVGTFLLKDMFSRENTYVESLISTIIENENKSNPLDDEKIRIMLNEKGINISRRTVAKYRGKLNILPYKKRAKG